MLEFPTPTNKAALQRFLGIINFYHRFLPNIAQILMPLHKAVAGKKGKDIDWNPECEKAFVKAKESLAKATLLHHPSATAETALVVDASDKAMGGQVEQKIGGRWVPIAFFSQKLSVAETKYSAFDRELLGIYSAVKHFQHFIEGLSLIHI